MLRAAAILVTAMPLAVVSAAETVAPTVETVAQPPETAAPLPEAMELEYEVERGALLHGVSRRTLAHKNGVYTARAFSRPRGLLRGVKVDEASEFRLRGFAVQTLRYHSRQSGIRPHDREFIFDYAAGKIFGGESELQIPAETVLDYANLPFAFMAMPPAALDAIGGRVFHLADGRRLRTFTAQAPRMEALRTPLATLRALRIDFTRNDRDDRRIHLWLAPEFGNVMARLELRRGGKTATVFALSKVEVR